MITFEKEFIYFSSDDQKAKKLDAIWIKSRKCWKLPNTLGALREMHRLGFDVMEYGKQKAKARETILSVKNSEPTTYLDKRLRPYQQTDINFLMQLPNAGVFNEQRTGKTPTTLKLIEAEGHEKIMVICPASLVLQWEKEVKTWTSLPCTVITQGKQKRLKSYMEWNSKKGFLILSKDTAKADLNHLKNEGNYVLIVDESAFLRNYKSLQSKAIFDLGKNAVKKLALTGTPGTNKGSDCYGILHFLFPEMFPSYWQFLDRYFKQWKTPWGTQEVSGYKRKEELQEILDLISVQRKRSEVMKWVEPKVYQSISVEMGVKQRKAYEEMLHLFTVDEAGVDASGVLAQLTRLRQICLAPELLDIKAPSAKEQFILEWLEDNPDEQVIIFSNFSSYLKKLHDKIMKFDNLGMIIGETTKEHRAKVVDYFQSGKIRIILANIQAAGTGLTLDAAGTVIFLDRDYTVSSNQQAEDRIVPTTQQANQSCTIIDVVCKNSIDEHINDLLSKKQNIIKVINDYNSIGELMK
jgi:SNF2 family DNA or RNA helicase